MILTKPKLRAQQRFDLSDWEVLLNSAETDAKYWTKSFLAQTAYILSGFEVSGTASPASIALDGSTLINPNNSGIFSWYVGEVGASPLTATLNASTRNYIELELSSETSTPLTKAFWDKAAASGSGAEFNQIVDTVTDLNISVVVLTGAFSGSANRIPVAIIDTDSSNNIKLVLDKRPRFFKSDFTWSSQTEPSITLTLSGGSGTYLAGETVTFGGSETATVKTGGTTSITVIGRSADTFVVGDTVVGGTSTASRTLTAASESFTGADRDIENFRDMFSALSKEIKSIKGADYWFESYVPNISSGTAGETLAANDWVYVSDGTGVDSGRTAGRLYKADGSVTNGSIRGQAVGVITTGGSTGAKVKYQPLGRVTLSGLTAGSIYYISPSSAGTITATRPTTTAQTICPVGFALSSTELVITIGDSEALGSYPANSVTDAALRQSAGYSVIGNTTNATANVADITAANAYDVLQRVGSTLAFQPLKQNYRSVTTTDSPTVNDSVLALSGASFTITLPSAVGIQGKELTFLHEGTSLSQVYTFATTSGQTVGGLATTVYKLHTNGERLKLISDNANWKVVEHKAETDWVDTSEPLVGFYTFVISSGNATIGATYTNSGNTYTVAKTVAAGLSLIAWGTAAPAASGTLTKSGGTGDATLTFSSVSGSINRVTATTTTPTFYGSPLVNQMIWRRHGKFCTVRARFHQTTAGVAGSGDYIFPCPLNITIDTTYYPTFTGGTVQSVQSQVAASGVALQHTISGRITNESGAGQAFVTDWAPYTSTSYRVYDLYVNGDTAQSPGSTYTSAGVAIISYNWEVTFPVSGWQP